MHAQENAETAGLKQCLACDAEQRVRDKFCRRCGVRRRQGITFAASNTDWPARDTAPLPVATRCDSVSGALVSLVAEGVSARAASLSSSLAGNRWASWLAGALVAVPLWFIIVLLSPLDAYVAARAIAKQV